MVTLTAMAQNKAFYQGLFAKIKTTCTVNPLNNDMVCPLIILG